MPLTSYQCKHVKRSLRGFYCPIWQVLLCGQRGWDTHVHMHIDWMYVSTEHMAIGSLLSHMDLPCIAFVCQYKCQALPGDYSTQDPLDLITGRRETKWKKRKSHFKTCVQWSFGDNQPAAYQEEVSSLLQLFRNNSGKISGTIFTGRV